MKTPLKTVKGGGWCFRQAHCKPASRQDVPVWTPHKQLLVTSSPRNLVALNNLPREERTEGREGKEETERERVKRVWGEVRKQTKSEVNSS